MAGPVDYERARALLRAQVSGAAPSTTTAVGLRHRVVTTAGLAAVASAVIVGSWWAVSDGPITSTAVASDARSVPGSAPAVRGPIPALATVGGVQVVSVPAAGGGVIQVVVGPVSAMTLGAPALAQHAPSAVADVESPSRPTEVGDPAVTALPTLVRSGGGGRASTPTPTTPAPTRTAPSTVTSPTVDPPASSVPPAPSTATSPSTQYAPPGGDPAGPGSHTGSPADESGESGSSSTS